jgi:ribosomal protein S18 acetylase RimI-like enzyme
VIECRDWRGYRSATVEPLVAAEARAWREELDWDVTEAWSIIEPARRAGRLPGYLVGDSGAHPSGWTSFLLHGECLQVLALVAPDEQRTHELVSAILTSAEAGRATSSLFCVRDASPGLRSDLLSRGFAVETYRYLRTGLNTIPRIAPTGVIGWQHHGRRVASLCERAYADSPYLRAFALDGTSDQWRDYIDGLLQGPGCGRFLPGMSFVSPAPGRTDDLDGAVVTTMLAPGVAHIAQVAVDPRARGRGLGRRLVVAAASAAARRGFTSLTLLVSAGNAPAVRIYEGLGFQDRAAFLVATRRQPRLSTSRALATGGASTRR